MSLLCIFVGLAYSPASNLPANLPEFLRIATALLPSATDYWNPVWVLGFAWLAVGLVGLVAPALHKKPELVYHIQVGLFSYWSLSYCFAWILGEPRGWVVGSWFAVLAGATWNFTRVDPPFRGIWRRFAWTRR